MLEYSLVVVPEEEVKVATRPTFTMERELLGFNMLGKYIV